MTKQTAQRWGRYNKAKLCISQE